MPFGLQPLHLIVIVIIALLIFGPRRLPDIGRAIGRALKELRKGAQEMSEGFRDEVNKSSDEHTTAQPEQPKSAKNITCGKCGIANQPDARFCHKCGNQLS